MCTKRMLEKLKIWNPWMIDEIESIKNNDKKVMEMYFKALSETPKTAFSRYVTSANTASNIDDKEKILNAYYSRFES